jgi:Dolichyl-phosphate-mannose-protein mannosyltransferase
MAIRFGSRWHPLARLVIAETLVPVGVAAAAGIAASMIVPPHWRAAGLPYLLGYGKNVEAAAIAAALAAGALTQLFVGSRRGLGACALLAALGLALAAARCPPAALLSGWPRLAAIAGLAAMLGVAASESARAAPAGDAGGGARSESGGGSGAGSGAGSGSGSSSGSGGRGRGGDGAGGESGGGSRGEALSGPAAAALVGAAALSALTFAAGPALLSIDVFHHGEVLSTAVDLLRGGRPFETLLWPHGLHDTGLTALWILATGKVGTSPVALARASCGALGVVSAYVLARRLLDSRLAGLAACLAVAFAPLLFDESQLGPAAWALDQLGVLVFVVLGFAAVTARRRRYLVAGLCCGLAYLFRVETGVYAILAALGVIAYRELAGADRAWRRPEGSGEAAGEAVGEAARPWAFDAWAAARALGAGVLAFLAGAALVLAGFRLLFGWPGGAWFAYTLGELPRYHRDAAGIPLPWPRRGLALSPGESGWAEMSLAWLLLTLLLLVQALRAAVGHAARSGARARSDPRRVCQLLFVALFAALSAKSGLDRSDPSHLVQWAALPLLAAGCLAVAGWRDRRSWAAGRAALAVFVLLLALDPGQLYLRASPLRGPTELARAALARWRAFLEHLGPNPPVGACRDRMFTPAEAGAGDNRRFIDGECTVEGLLRAHGVGRMVTADSAAWYDVRFHLRPATRYYALARAYTPARQLELIEALRGAPVQALLLPRGYGAIRVFDVPDAVRVPVADAYLRGRREGVAPTPTPLGDLFFWNDPDGPGACAPVAPQGGGGQARVALAVKMAAFQPASGALYAQGWAADAAARRPLAALAVRGIPPGTAASLDYGLDSGDAPTGGGDVGGTGGPGGAEGAEGPLRRTGWELVVRGWRTWPGTRGLELEAVTAGRGVARIRLDLSAARLLGPLRGAEWRGLSAAIDRAAALGRADRAAARSGSPGRPAGCD